MADVAAGPAGAERALDPLDRLGPLGRLGRWTVDNARMVALGWAVLAVALGAFAPKVEKALSGAGWQANGSESVQARALIQRDFGGLSSSALTVVVHSQSRVASDPSFRATVARVERILRSDRRVSRVVPPAAGTTISSDRHTALVLGGAASDPTAMVATADALKGKLAAAGAGGVTVSLTGASGMWSDFNTANRTAMMKSELVSWPVTLGILVLAFGSLVAAGLPLMLTILGLLASAGLLALLTHGFEISIWAMNFALMFALALGIDYALFVVNRFRGAFFGSRLDARDAVAVTMDTAGKAVLFSGLTVLVSLSAVMLVPSPAFRSMSLGIMLSVVFVLLATLTLLPAALARLGPRVDALALRWVHSGEHRSPVFARWGERLWRHPHVFGPAATLLLVLLALPVFGLKTGMPSIKVVPQHDASRVGYRSSSRRAKRRAPPRSPVATRASRPSLPRNRAATRSRSSRRLRSRTRPARPSAARSTDYARSCRLRRSSAAPRRRTTTSSEPSPRRRRS
jgi:RND superfamily putative drug exporter